jgi:hypothetical protein
MTFLTPIAVVLLVLGLSGGTWRFWDTSAQVVVPAGRYLYLPGAALLFITAGLWLFKKYSATALLKEAKAETNGVPAFWGLTASTLALIALFLSDWLTRPYSFSPGGLIRGQIFLGTLVTWFLLSRGWGKAVAGYSIATAVLLFWSFTSTANGRLLFSDDHAMFLFRLQLLKENFPSIPFWSPLWNGGFDARDFFATGALNAFLLAAPLVYAFDVTSIYNTIVALILWGTTPLFSFLAARRLSADRTVASLAALLSICCSLFWYRWALKYGTIGFVVSTSLFPLVVALGQRFLTTHHLERWEIPACIIAITLMLLWSPSGIALAPLFLLALPYSIRVLRSRRHLLTLVLIAALNIPWMIMLWRVSAVTRFLDTPSHKVSSPEKAESNGVQDSVDSPQTGEVKNAPTSDQPQATAFRFKGGFDLWRSLKSWQEGASATNPLLLILGIPALLTLPTGLQRKTYITLAIWLTLLGSVGVTLLPQLEFDRMLVILSMLLCYPVARFIGNLFSLQGARFTTRLSTSVIGGFLFASPFCVSSVVLNRTLEQYSFASPAVAALNKVINENVADGRALFTGCVLHQLSGGHLAPLALWSQTPIVASSYAHNIWHYEQPIPKSFMDRDEAGITEFFDLMNASIVLAHEPYWKKFFQRFPEAYREIWRGEGFIAFKRSLFVPSWTTVGTATLHQQTSHSLTVVPATPSVVLKIKFFPFLQSSSCTIRKESISPELDLVALDGCATGVPVTIDSISPLQRLLLKAR